MAARSSGRDRRARNSGSALGVGLLFIIAMTVAAFLPHFLFGMPQPPGSGSSLMIVAVLATFVGLYMDHVLSSEEEGIERYALEVSLAAAGALLSLAIAQQYPKGDTFAAGKVLLQEFGVQVSTPRQASWTLAAFSFILVATSFTIAAVIKKHSLKFLTTLLRIISLFGLLVAYTLFLVTILYVG